MKFLSSHWRKRRLPDRTHEKETKVVLILVQPRQFYSVQVKKNVADRRRGTTTMLKLGHGCNFPASPGQRRTGQSETR